MKYDLIVIGGGPGGLMAARAAAEDGLKVVLVETKKDIPKISRLCSATIPIRAGGFSTTHIPTDKQIEPVSVSLEISLGRNRIHFPKLGFSVDYSGSLRFYHNEIYLSPSGYPIYRYAGSDVVWGFQIDKEALLADLLASVERAGVEVWPETKAMGVEDTPDGVKVPLVQKKGERVLEGRKVIAADGAHSRIVECLGFNARRKDVGPQNNKLLMYIMDGVETGFPESSAIEFTIPGINPEGGLNLALWPGGLTQVVSTTMGGGVLPQIPMDKLLKHPRYAGMFRHAKVVRKLVCAMPMRTAIEAPVAGNVYIVGDGASLVETGIKGAMACGYQAVKAIEKDFRGEDGRRDFIDWWQHSFYFNSPEYVDTVANIYRLGALCSDEEVDYIYNLFRGKTGMPSDMVAENMELIKQKDRKLYRKLAGGITEVTEGLTWTKEAEESLKRVPRMVRPMARRAVEKYAVKKGAREITAALMLEAREKAG